MRDWGTGGKYQQITQAVTGALQGVFNGDLTQALANGSALFLAEAIKNATTHPDGSVNTEANLAAHAILGALLSQANGNSALAGGLGALTAEAAAKLIKDQLYGDKSFQDLTDAERQNISALAQIAAGVAGGLAGDSSSDTAQGAIAGKNAVENNNLGNVININPDYVNGAVSLAQYLQATGATPEEIYAALLEYSKGDHVPGDPAAAIIQAYVTSLFDFIPIIGDAKSFAEAEDKIDLAIAIFGVMPLSEPVSKILKEAKTLAKNGDYEGANKLINEAHNAAQFENYKNQLIQQMSKPNVDNNELKLIVDNMYRNNAKIGSGSTADAVRHELKTGELVAGKDHIEKAENYVEGLKSWLKNNPTASSKDRAAAENILKDLQNALNGN